LRDESAVLVDDDEDAVVDGPEEADVHLLNLSPAAALDGIHVE